MKKVLIALLVFMSLVMVSCTNDKLIEPIEPNPDSDEEVVEIVTADIAAFEKNMVVNEYELNLPIVGESGKTNIDWEIEHMNISKEGIMLPVDLGESNTTTIKGTFTLDAYQVEKSFNVVLPNSDPVDLQTTRSVDFVNLNTEYHVADSKVDLLYESNGTVPYIKVRDFLDMLVGFIDPNVVFLYEEIETGIVKISYTYYSELDNLEYILECYIDTMQDLISVNYASFFSNYVSSTETNYGRHIEYDLDNDDNYEEEGQKIEYDLGKYYIDAVMVDGDVVLPYALVNQLFAGSSYYNVYYNYDQLTGVYAVPEDVNAKTIKKSTKSNTTMSGDMSVSNFYTLMFYMDYFYGLKDIMGIDSYKELLLTYKDQLLVKNPRKFEEGFSNFLDLVIDEMHTSYRMPSYLNSPNWEGPTNLKYINTRKGDRGSKFYTDAYVGVNSNKPNTSNFWSLDDKHVVVELNDFNTADLYETTTYDADILSYIMDNDENLIPGLSGGDKYIYYNQSTQTYRAAEILIKNPSSEYRDSYVAALSDFGYVNNGAGTYYKKVIDGQVYTLYVKYDGTYDVLYLGIKDDGNGNADLKLKTESMSLDELIYSDTAIYLEFTMEAVLDKYPSVNHIVLDITENLGGNVGALYRVVGFITDQPFRVSNIDGDTKAGSNYYVAIDGVPKYNHFSWSLLTSGISFSAANSLATIFKENALGKVIGQTSGGGASSITPIILPNGTIFSMSSNNISAYRTGAGTESDPFVYHNNEFGIKPDVIIPVNLMWNKNSLLAAIGD